MKIDALQQNSERLETQAEKRKDLEEKFRDLDRQLLGWKKGTQPKGGKNSSNRGSPLA